MPLRISFVLFQFLNDSLGRELVDILQGFGTSRNSQERDRERRVTRSRGEAETNTEDDQTTQTRSAGRYRTSGLRNRLRLRCDLITVFY